MSRWFSGSSAAGLTPIQEVSALDPGVRAALLRLAAREASMLESQVNFLTPELLQADSLVREAAGTLGAALQTLNQSVHHQHLLAREVQENLNASLKGDSSGGGADSAGSIMGTVDGLV